uniref:Tox-REase-5 domain-containing protein n=2 Tax=Acetivibrio straminisolvens TaxID=253314 RepID=UPI002240D69A
VGENRVLVHNANKYVKGTSKTLSGRWGDVNESMSDLSRAYQKQITGREGQAFLQNSVKFDGMKNGRLIEAKGSYNNFIDKNTGEFYDWFMGKQSLIDQAKRQIAASEGAPIDWYFMDEASMNATKSLFQDANINGINFIYEPLK